jgi:hypothetical protein
MLALQIERERALARRKRLESANRPDEPHHEEPDVAVVNQGTQVTPARTEGQSMGSVEEGTTDRQENPSRESLQGGPSRQRDRDDSPSSRKRRKVAAAAGA